MRLEHEVALIAGGGSGVGLKITGGYRRRILQPEDIAAAVLFIATLPKRVAVPEILMTPAM